jgi:hypothetical protein
VGRNFVFKAREGGMLDFVERDDWRWEGIGWINEWNAEVYGW